MSSRKPIVRQIAWIALLPQLILMGLLIFIFSLIISPIDTAFIYAMVTYLAISLILRRAIPYNHRKGISLYKAGKYPQAIEEFEKSYDFFGKHSWIDKYRFRPYLAISTYL